MTDNPLISQQADYSPPRAGRNFFEKHELAEANVLELARLGTRLAPYRADAAALL
jgi:hypothetical protein